MRKLMYFTIGFAAACGLCAYLLPVEVLTKGAAVCGTCGIIGVILFRNHGVLLRGMVILLGCAAGLSWYQLYHGVYLKPADYLDEKIRPATIRAADYGYEADYGSAFDGTVLINGHPYQIKTYLNDAYDLSPGMELTGEFLFRRTLPDEGEGSFYNPGKGIFLLAIQRGDLKIRQAEYGLADRIAEIRFQIRSILETSFPADTAAFAKALLLGDASDLDYETDTNFKLSGIRHVIAVSGLHVSILFALISTVTFRKRFLTALLGFPALFFFAALAGFTPSVCRACIMSGLMLLAMAAQREYDSATALAFAVLVMLLGNPLVITAIGFQLSVASVAGIYLFEPSIRKWLLSVLGEEKDRRIRHFFIRWFCTSVSVSLSAMTLTTPLCAVYFGTVSLVSVFTNLLTLWVISGIFYGILGVLLAAHFSSTGAIWLAKMISFPVRYVLGVAGILGKFPLAAVYTRSPYIALWLVFVYLLLLVFLLQHNKRPQTLICCGVLGLCAALLASWAEPALSDVRFSVLDVGQGQCLLLQYKGSSFLVDCGGDSDARSADIAAETLLSQGITELDGLILTHLDRDHAGGVKHLLTRVDTKLLILPSAHTDIPESTDGRVIFAVEPLCITCEEMKMQIFTANFPGNSNEMSLCLLFDTEKCDILITGDRNGFGERNLLRYHSIPDVDILVAGHHGSGNAACEELLEAVHPEIVCISVGADNSYGHPAPQLLERLKQRHCTVYRTDKDGTILIRR